MSIVYFKRNGVLDRRLEIRGKYIFTYMRKSIRVYYGDSMSKKSSEIQYYWVKTKFQQAKEYVKKYQPCDEKGNDIIIDDETLARVDSPPPQAYNTACSAYLDRS